MCASLACILVLSRDRELSSVTYHAIYTRRFASNIEAVPCRPSKRDYLHPDLLVVEFRLPRTA